MIELTEQMMVRTGGATARSRFSEVLALFVLATVAFLFGAVQTWVWSVYTVVLYAAFIVFIWQQSRGGAVVEFNGYTTAVGLFLGLTLLACLPLPDWLMGVLSPNRYQLLVRTRELTGLATTWPTLSYVPWQSLAWWAFLLGLVFLFVILRTCFAMPGMLRWSLKILLVLAVFQGLYGILQTLIPNLGVLWSTKSGLGDARGTWINRNHFANFMGMMLPLLLGYSLSKVRWRARIKLKTLLQSDRIHRHSLFLLALVIMALSLLFSKSRAGILAFFFGGGTFFFLIRGKDRKMSKRFWMIGGVLFCLIVLYGLRMGFDPILNRFFALGGSTSRLDFWHDSLAIIFDHPLGTGLATFKDIFPVYNVTARVVRVTPHYLHNDALQLLVETGWPGFILLISAYLAFMVESFRRIRRMEFHTDPKRFLISAGAFSGLVTISFHSLFDFNLQIPANAVYFVVLLAMVRALTDERNLPGHEHKPHRCKSRRLTTASPLAP